MKEKGFFSHHQESLIRPIITTTVAAGFIGSLTMLEEGKAYLVKVVGNSTNMVYPIDEIEFTPAPEINSTEAVEVVPEVINESDDNKFNDWVDVLFDQSVLAESGQLDDPARFVEKLNKLMLQLSQ